MKKNWIIVLLIVVCSSCITVHGRFNHMQTITETTEEVDGKTIRKIELNTILERDREVDDEKTQQILKILSE